MAMAWLRQPLSHESESMSVYATQCSLWRQSMSMQHHARCATILIPQNLIVKAKVWCTCTMMHLKNALAPRVLRVLRSKAKSKQNLCNYQDSCVALQYCECYDFVIMIWYDVGMAVWYDHWCDMLMWFHDIVPWHFDLVCGLWFYFMNYDSICIKRLTTTANGINFNQ